MKRNERLQALRILMNLLQEKISLSHLFQTQSELTALTKEICFGVCRHYFRLQALADCLVGKRPKAFDVWLVLLIGLYQLHFMQKPDYAVVKETVALLEPLKKSWAKGLVNAVLRTYCREQMTLLTRLQESNDFLYGHPAWLLQRLQTDWPCDWQNIVRGNEAHPPMSLRVNRVYGDRESYLQRLQQKGIKAYPTTDAIMGVTLEVACNVEELPGFATGDVSVQDEAAQLAVSLLSLQPGLRLLDACCAPGGKTCHILETESKLKECVALDIDEKRLQRVRENLMRLNLKATVLQGDGLKPESWWDGQFFERILLDAPCSATGVIRRHSDIKLLRTATEVTEIAYLQKGLLQSLWSLLAPQGLLIYATCSILKEENEQQIAQFVASHPDCHVATEQKIWGRKTGYGWQILSGENNRDGFFYSVLKKG
jgi:16S rRNA (cytosine967-C5)-methyltransferase